MTTLDDAWGWYRAVADMAKWHTHLAKFWGALPWGTGDEWVTLVERDNVLRHVEVGRMRGTAEAVTAELDHLAVLVLFSVFEANVRDHLKAQLQPEVDRLRHPSLVLAGAEVLEAVESGSFGRLVQSFKLGAGDKDLVARVDQVRKHRNWVAHGRRAEMRPDVLIRPRDAYQRLTEFLDLVRRYAPTAPPAEGAG